jgi:hypothetical protein
MQERRLRLGDVLDDYCPREKRLTNHVIVALVEDEVRQTRCTTCDTEHPYKKGRVPVRRKKADTSAVLYKQVLDNLSGTESEAPEAASAPPVRAAAAPPADLPEPPPAAAVSRPEVEPAPRAAAATPAARTAAPVPMPAEPAEPSEPAEPPHQEPVHRHQLIRATLPKIEGQVPERKPADFTMWNVSRHAQARRGHGGRRGPADGNVGYSPFGNGHPKAPITPAGRPAQGKSPSRRNRRGGR